MPLDVLRAFAKTGRLPGLGVPDAKAAFGGGDQKVAIWREYGGKMGARKRFDFAPRAGVPNLDLCVSGAGQQIATRRKRHCGRRVRKRFHHASRGDLANDRFLAGGEGQQFAVGRKGRAVEPAGRRSVSERREFVALTEIPEMSPFQPAQVLLARLRFLTVKQFASSTQIVFIERLKGHVHLGRVSAQASLLARHLGLRFVRLCLFPLFFLAGAGLDRQVALVQSLVPSNRRHADT